MKRTVFRRLTAAAASAAMLVSALGSSVFFSPAAANADPSGQTELCPTTLSLFPGGTQSETVVTLDGLMPEGATAEAVDVTADYAAMDSITPNEFNAAFTEAQEVSVLAAFDITISDGKKEYQPDESRPITVTISHAQLTADSAIQIWHIPEDGSREQITDFTLTDGAVTFSAEGFSVYEIVEVSEPEEPPQGIAQTLDELDGNPFYMSIFKSGKGTYWFMNYINGTNPPSIQKTLDQNSAAVWYFEKVGETGNQYRLYTYINGVKTYAAMTIQDFSGTNRGAMSLTTDSTVPETVFDVSLFMGNPGAFYIAREGYALNLVKSGEGPGFAGWYDREEDDVGSKVVLTHAPQSADDPAGLDEMTCGLMVFPSADSSSKGAALMSEQHSNSANKRKAQQVDARTNPMTLGELYVPADSDITMWTFQNLGQNQYYITTEADGVTKYLQLSGGNLTLADTPDANCILTVTQGTGENAGKIRITKGNYAIRLHNGAASNGFNGSTSNDAYTWLNLATLSNIRDEDFVANSAQKVSVSDTVNVANGKKVIVYTRVWNPDKLGYDFYIVDHAGRLFPAYEVGDNIEWYGLQIDNLLWDFTEHYYEGTTTPNYYYDLQNTYSDQFLAPQFTDGQTLSPSKIGLNLNGRKNDQYSTTILAWDEKYYQYAGLKADLASGKLVTCPMSQAGDFCFAVIEPSSNELTTVDTINNNDYSIKMRMVNFGDIRKINGSNRSWTQYNVLHDDIDWVAPGLTPYSDLISAWLEDSGDNAGYPTATKTGTSLSELFAGATTVNHLFLEKTHDESGYFEYNCTNNFAHLNADGNFTVYDQVGTVETSPTKQTLKHGQFLPYNDLTPGLYSELHANETDSKSNPLPIDDPRREKPLYQIPYTGSGKVDYFFGMEMEAGFTQTHSGLDAWGNDMIFEFTGDDDFWLYVDGVRVIDLGGIHSALSGSVNFRTGEVKVDSYPDTTLRQIFTDTFIAKYKAEHDGAEPTTAQINAYLADYFEPGENMFKDFSTHKMKVFYMERGEGASNLHMRFNLSAVKPGQVLLSKEVTGSSALDFALVDYPFQIWYKISNEEGAEYKLLDPNESTPADNIEVYYQNSQSPVKYKEHYQLPGTTETYDHVFFLSAGESAYIDFPDNIYTYYIKECGINTEVYNSVSCNGTALTGISVTGSEYRKDYACAESDVNSRPAVTYENHVDPGKLRTWEITKRLYDSNGQEIRNDNKTEFDFRVYMDSEDISFDDLSYAQMHQYRVKDSDGYYYRWDSDTERFVSTGKKDPALLNDADSLFYTSPNGTISKIPAWYTIELLNLPVGTRFKVEEKETPLGYRWWKYESDKQTYISVDTDTHNMGTVRENESPKTYVCNKRGFGIQAQKVWTDNGSVSSHDPVYMAVYLRDAETETETLVSEVKQIISPADSVSWFFESLAEGKQFADYIVREVRLTGARFDSSGNLTGYDSAVPVGEGQPLTVQATPKGSDTPEDIEYSASYSTGTPTGSTAGVKNTRKDTVTNKRNSGIELMLGAWNGTAPDRIVETPLAGGTFTLTLEKRRNEIDANGDPIEIVETFDYGEFVTDSDGVITLLYGYPLGENNVWTLTETQAPAGYTGLSQPVKFYITEEDGEKQIHFIQPATPDGWHNAVPGADNIDGVINIYNKQFILEAIKYDAQTNDPLPGAEFALYKGRRTGSGYIKDYIPMDGYDTDTLISGADGVIPLIDNTLPAGRYYLTEESAPRYYDGISADIVFEVTSAGEVILISAPGSVSLRIDTETVGIAKYRISIRNARANDPNADLTVTKIVGGVFGDKTEDFTFTLTVDGAAPDDTFNWSKNGEEQTPLQSGGTFTLGHNDTAVFSLPKDTAITLAEDNAGYQTAFRLGNADAEECASMQFALTEPTELTVTNTYNGVIPTGVAGSAVSSLLLFTLPLLPIGCVLYYRKRRRYAV